MSASVADKITDTRNAARPNSARVTSGRSSGAATLACDNLTGWPTASKVHLVTYQINSNSNPVSGTQLDCYGIVSGNNIGSFTVLDGTDNGNVVGDVVEMLPTAAWGQDLADALMASHDRDGTLKDGVVDSAAVLANNVVTSAKILDANVTTTELADANVTDAKLIYGKLRRRQGGNASDWSVPGTTNFDTSATNTFIQSGSATVAGTTGSETTITFPVAFTQTPVVIVSTGPPQGANVNFAVNTPTTTNFKSRILFTGGGSQSEVCNWIAIGQ
jgi:hypothetical protein